MNAGVPVFADLPAYRVAVASLPVRARIAGEPAGGIVVVDGAADWSDAVTQAISAGASAVLIAEPRGWLDPLPADLVERWPVPVIVHRSQLRHDIVSRAVTQRAGVLPRIVVAECRSTVDGLPAMVRDAAGWMRELSQASLGVAAAAVGRGGGTALLRAETGKSVVGSMSITVTRPEGAILRLTALGETTTDVEFDEPMGRFELATSTSTGRLVAPASLEAGERVALRRALDAVAEGSRPSDLSDLVHDDHVARDILSARHDRFG